MTPRLHPLDFVDFEKVLLAMAMRDPQILDLLDVDLLDEPAHVRVFRVMCDLRDRGELLTPEAIRAAAGDDAVYAPAEPWFTTRNVRFYLSCLQGRRREKRLRAQLTDSLAALDRGADPDDVLNEISTVGGINA